MKKTFLVFLGIIAASSVCFASNEGVPSYYSQNNKPTTANRNAYNKYQNYGYTKYVGNSGKKQIVSSQNYSYQVPRAQLPAYPNSMTMNGIAQPTDTHNTSIFAGYSRRFADFQFKTGVNSVLEWDDMIFNEMSVGMSHVFDIRGFDLGIYGTYTYGKLSKGGLSMDYDLEPYDYKYPTEGIFTISMGDQTGETSKLKIGATAHHIWDIAGWKVSPHIGYEIFKHDLKMSNHIYPNPGVYLPLMTADGKYVFGNTEDYYFAVPQDVNLVDSDGLYQVCMGPEDILVVKTPTGADLGNGIQQIVSLTTELYDEATMGLNPWGVPAGDCVVIGGDGVISVGIGIKQHLVTATILPYVISCESNCAIARRNFFASDGASVLVTLKRGGGNYTIRATITGLS